MRLRREPPGISLREYVDVRLAELERRLTGERQLLVAANEDRRTEMERRLNTLNELRAEVVSDRGLLVRREFLDATLESMEKALEARRVSDKAALERLAEDIRSIQKADANLQGRLWALGVGLTIVVVVVNVVIRFIH